MGADPARNTKWRGVDACIHHPPVPASYVAMAEHSVSRNPLILGSVLEDKIDDSAMSQMRKEARP